MAAAIQRDEAARQRNRAAGMRTEERKQNYEQFKCRTDPGDYSHRHPFLLLDKIEDYEPDSMQWDIKQ